MTEVKQNGRPGMDRAAGSWKVSRKVLKKSSMNDSLDAKGPAQADLSNMNILDKLGPSYGSVSHGEREFAIPPSM